MTFSEPPLEMARRHVREAEGRLARQEALVVKMEAVGMTSELYLGYQLLDTLRQTLAQMRADLARLERARDLG